MRTLKEIANVYFIGIGGIGMSALAYYFLKLGKKVAGYDKTASSLTKSLEAKGCEIHFEDSVDKIPAALLDAKKTLVIYTPAIPSAHSELKYVREQDFWLLKRSEVLGMITKDAYTLAVAGTHGKTTTSTILAYLLNECGVSVTAFLGGISENYNSNFVMSGTDVMVVEADEYDRSFLRLHPNVAAITSMDVDHLDIYDQPGAFADSFRDFAAQVSETLFVKKGLAIEGKSIGVNEAADYSVDHIRVNNGTYIFDLKMPGETVYDLNLTLPGLHNLSNATMAFVMAHEYGVAVSALAKALPKFRGVQRRFSYQIKSNALVFIDDYAHHPTEIDALHQAVREMHPDKKVLAIFQPHLYSRTRDFAIAFGKSLSQFDRVLLLGIYPARETAIPGITSDWLASLLTTSVAVTSKQELKNQVTEAKESVIVTLGAGDIGEYVAPLKELLMNRVKKSII